MDGEAKIRSLAVLDPDVLRDQSGSGSLPLRKPDVSPDDLSRHITQGFELGAVQMPPRPFLRQPGNGCGINHFLITLTQGTAF